MAGTQTSDTTTEEPEKVPRWRRILCGVLVVLVCILAPLSLLAVWTRNTLLNTDQYVETMAPLAEDPDVQQAIADRIVEALTTNVDLEQEVSDALPPRAAFAAPFVAQGIERFVHEASLRLLESDRFQTLWENANRRAHSAVVAVLTGNEDGRITTKNGEVVVQLGPVVQTVQEKLSSLGVDVFGGSGGERAPRQFVLFKSEGLTKIQGAVDLLDQLAVVLPILLVVMLAAAIALSGNRRRTILRTAIWIAVGMALVLVIFNVGRSFYLDAFRNRDAAAASYDQILGFLRLSARTALVVAIIVAIGAWLAGPGRTATRIREGVKKIGSGDEGEGIQQSRIGRFVSAHKTLLRAIVIGLALLALVVLSAVTPLTVLVIAVLVVVGLVLIEFLGRGTPIPTTSTAAPAEKAADKRSI
jgi:hypothetical protein